MYPQPLRLLLVLGLLAASSWAQQAYIQLDFELYKEHKWRCVDNLAKKVKLYSYNARVFATCDLDRSFERDTKKPKPANASVTIKCGGSGKDDWVVVTWYNQANSTFDRSDGGDYWRVGWTSGNYFGTSNVTEYGVGIMVQTMSQNDKDRNLYASQRSYSSKKSLEEVLAATRGTAVRRRGTKPPKGVLLPS